MVISPVNFTIVQNQYEWIPDYVIKTIHSQSLERCSMYSLRHTYK